VADTIVHLSSIIGAPLLDSEGGRLGRIEDAVVRLDEASTPLPAAVGLVARIGGREMFVPVSSLEALEGDKARTATTKLNLAQFDRRPGEVLLRADVLDRSLINVQTASLVTARDVELVREQGTWRVAGVDTSLRARLYRFLPRSFRGHDTEHTQFVPWRDMEPLLGHVPTSRLKLGARRVGRLHPAQIADLVEAASHEEGEEILAAVSQDKELEADVFEELDDEHQAEFLRERSDPQVAAVLERMASDDVADLLLEIQQERRLPILNLLSPGKRAKVQGLLGYNPSTAGGLMNPDFVVVPVSATVEESLARVRESSLGLQQIATVCVVDEGGALVDAVSLAELVRATPSQCLSELTDPQLPTVSTDADLPEVARLMADYNLVAMPVLDPGGAPVGIIAVDDVLELLIPEEWRRRTGAARS
jgi:CBS domain-containing protein